LNTNRAGYGKVFLSIAAFMVCIGCAELQQTFPTGELLRGVLTTPGSQLDERTVSAGLKEALRVGTERTVFSTSRMDGYLGNALIRIALPDEYQPVAQTLRTIGLGGQVDSLETAMNRAAEQAAGEAKNIFWNAISQMTLTDALGILNGGQTAATDYFRDRTTHNLRNRFRPIVSQKMGEVGLYQVYNQFMTVYNTLPLLSKPALNLEDYVTDKAMGGLFTVLADEERKIRENPAARTTDLLRQVFGR
jgi:hypothetical protein